MGLSKAAILALRGLDTEKRAAMAKAMGKHIATLNRWIANNDDNLTKAANLALIEKEIGLAGSEILKTEGAQN